MARERRRQKNGMCRAEEHHEAQVVATSVTSATPGCVGGGAGGVAWHRILESSCGCFQSHFVLPELVTVTHVYNQNIM